MEKKKYENRADIPLEHRWATEDLYPTDEAWEAELAAMTEMGKELAGFAGKLGSDAQTLLDYLTGMEKADVMIHRLHNYAGRRSDEDTRNSTYQILLGKLRSAMV